MVPRENKNNAYAKFGGTNKEYYVIFRTGLLRTNNKKIELNWTGAGLRELCGKAPNRNNGAFTFCRLGCLKEQ